MRGGSTYMDCMVSWMSCIQVLRSSLELARTSIISGFSMPAVMRKRPRSSLATSLTISFCREITVERWSCREEQRGASGGQEGQWEGRGTGGEVEGGELKIEGGGKTNVDDKQEEKVIMEGR